MRWIAALLALVAASAHAQAPLGRLFFTPQERAALDRDEAHPPDTGRAAPRIDGVVRRSDGHATVWIDGRAEARRLERADAVPVQDAEGSWSVLKAGERADEQDPALDIRIRRRP